MGVSQIVHSTLMLFSLLNQINWLILMQLIFLRETFYYKFKSSIVMSLNSHFNTHNRPLIPSFQHLLFCFFFLFAEKESGGAQQSKPSKPSKQTWRSQRVRPAPSQQPREDSKDSRHPFALYGSGEKDADMAGRKTHNVCPAASTHEVTSGLLCRSVFWRVAS